MNHENFCYWLSGVLETNTCLDGLGAAQVKVIQDHLALVMKKVTPEYKPLELKPNNDHAYKVMYPDTTIIHSKPPVSPNIFIRNDMGAIC